MEKNIHNLLLKNVVLNNKKNRNENKIKEIPKKSPAKIVSTIPYKSSNRILLIGEGNFSFARALIRHFDGNASSIVATSYDTEFEVRKNIKSQLKSSMI